MSNVYDLFTGRLLNREDLNKRANNRTRQLTGDSVYDKILNRFGIGYDRMPEMPLIGFYKSKRLYIDPYCGDVHDWKNSKPKFRDGTEAPLPLPYTRESIERAVNDTRFNTIVLGGHYDAFQWLDMKYGHTLNVIDLIIKKDHIKKVIIETRSDLIAQEDYIAALKRLQSVMELQVNVQLDSGNDYTERRQRSGCPSVKRRKVAAKALRKAGLKIKTIYNRKSA